MWFNFNPDVVGDIPRETITPTHQAVTRMLGVALADWQLVPSSLPYRVLPQDDVDPNTGEGHYDIEVPGHGVIGTIDGPLDPGSEQ